MKNRKFSFWYYTTSHRQALLRSVGKDGDDNIDIYFGDVSYLEIPTDIDGFEIIPPSQNDKDYINNKLGFISCDKLTVLVHEHQKYYILSSDVKIMRNNLSFFELPFDIPSDMGNTYYKPMQED